MTEFHSEKFGIFNKKSGKGLLLFPRSCEFFGGTPGSCDSPLCLLTSTGLLGTDWPSHLCPAVYVGAWNQLNRCHHHYWNGSKKKNTNVWGNGALWHFNMLLLVYVLAHKCATHVCWKTCASVQSHVRLVSERRRSACLPVWGSPGNEGFSLRLLRWGGARAYTHTTEGFPQSCAKA